MKVWFIKCMHIEISFLNHFNPSPQHTFLVFSLWPIKPCGSPLLPHFTQSSNHSSIWKMSKLAPKTNGTKKGRRAKLTCPARKECDCLAAVNFNGTLKSLKIVKIETVGYRNPISSNYKTAWKAINTFPTALNKAVIYDNDNKSPKSHPQIKLKRKVVFNTCNFSCHVVISWLVVLTSRRKKHNYRILRNAATSQGPRLAND